MVPLRQLEPDQSIRGIIWPWLIPYIKFLGSGCLADTIQCYLGFHHPTWLCWQCKMHYTCFLFWKTKLHSLYLVFLVCVLLRHCIYICKWFMLVPCFACHLIMNSLTNHPWYACTVYLLWACRCPHNFPGTWNGFLSKLEPAGVYTADIVFGHSRGNIRAQMNFMIMKGDGLPMCFIIGNGNINVFDIRVHIHRKYFTLWNNFKREIWTGLLQTDEGANDTKHWVKFHHGWAWCPDGQTNTRAWENWTMQIGTKTYLDKIKIC